MTDDTNHPMAMGFGMGGHQSPKSLKDEWLTPPYVIEAIGGADSFNLDPCSPINRPWATARQHLTVQDDGLAWDWEGRVWLNPPYGPPSVVGPWMRRMAAHGRGTALIFARTETELFFETVWSRATALLFIQGRLHFHHVDGTRAAANAGAPSVLIAYGADDADVLAFGSMAGKFVPLRLPRSVVVEALEPSWRDVVSTWLKAQSGPVSVSDLYRALADHRKTQGRANWRAKVRQTLARGAGRRVGPDQWAAA